ncbi:ABC transporter ATP-binding protein [Rhodococcus sp. TAF43]|uniref:ABC transporter ATP-binding protein n=1 Tax=unclassified Rhodococcus (in: high G+C Gram-positive bacteria) TaxID=192944 RepID=UPI0015819E69|nr:ABC transporter ATP-binding protein [Rhodococcus sp. W8901]QKT12007.1 ABC transporter ATP-binding protein [Rhodococcus sp. W8901]
MKLELSNVTKTYRGKPAVSDVTMRIGPGVLGLLGPNGAGKSSLMRILATITRPTAGSVTWNGADIAVRPASLRRVLGYLPQDFGVYPHLSAREFLRYLAAVKGLSARSARSRVDELLELVNLADTGSRPVGKFSGGMRQRLGIAQALLGDPEVLVVDEPTVGLDPEERMRFRNLLGDLASDRIVILSTHIVSDIEAIADDIAVLAGGHLRWRGAPADLLRSATGTVWELVVPADAVADIRRRGMVTRTVRTAGGVRVRAVATAPPTADACPVEPDLEDAYMFAVGPATTQFEVTR